MDSFDEDIRLAKDALKDADALMITAGAGMGVDSGLPDFRGDEGFWRAYPPMARLGISFVDMANPRWFNADPGLAWGFYGHRLNLYRQTPPHKGFGLLLDIAEEKSGGYFVFTSNVDGQFQKAGFDDEKIMECHGSIHHMQCTRNCCEAIWNGDLIDVAVDETTFRAAMPLPKCPHCGELARPNILMFGDRAWLSRRTDGQSCRLSSWLKGLRAKNMKLAVVEIGAGHAVPTVRYQSEQLVLSHCARLIRINPRDNDVPRGHFAIPLGGRDGIDALLQ